MLPLLLLACPAPEPPQLQGTFSDRPSVLLIVWDTVRADRMSLYGAAAPTTPSLDRLAASGHTFEQAISPGFWTLPAHASLFTGLPVSAHGATWKTPWLEDRFVTMAEWFAAHGYATFGWSTNPNIHPMRNTVQGMSTYLSPFGSSGNPWRDAVMEATEARKDPRDASTPASPAWAGAKKLAPTIAGPVAPGALRTWLTEERQAGQPYWAFVNLMETHDPRLPTASSRQTMLGSRLEESLLLDASPGRMRRASLGAQPYTEAERAILLDVFDATLSDLDASTDALLAELEAIGALENTIVVITSDHGDQFGGHGYYRHNRTLYDSLVRVPLVVHYPPAVPPGRTAAPVSTAGLFATLADLAGIPLPDTPHMHRDSLLADPPEAVFTDCLEPVGTPRAGDPPALWRSSRAVISGGWKLIDYSDGDTELFHRSTDPGEQHSRTDTEPAQVARLQGLLSAEIARLPRHTPVVPDDVRMLEADGRYGDGFLQSALEALGYVE